MAKKNRQKGVNRRDAIKTMAVIAGSVAVKPILGPGALASPQTHHHAAQVGATGVAKPVSQAPYKPLFFNERQLETVSTLSELIIPRTETPGAKDAKVHEYIDLIVSEDKKLQSVYLNGLEWIDRKANSRFGSSFIKCKPEQQTSILKSISSAKNLSDSEKVGADFFKTIKNMTIDGYYTSEPGITKELGYKGNDYLTEFPGCTHPEHQRASK